MSAFGSLLMDHPALDIGFQHAESLFVAGDGHLQGVREPLGSEEIDDDSLGELDRFRGGAGDLLVETKVNDQFLRRAGNAAEVGIGRQNVRLVDRHLNRLGGRLHALWNDLLGHE